MADELLSSDPNAGLLSSDPNAGVIPPNPTRIGPVTGSDTANVTLGDLIDNPRLALQRMRSILAKDLTDPTVMLPIAAGLAGKAYGMIRDPKTPSTQPSVPAPTSSVPSLGSRIRQNVTLDDMVQAIPGATTAKAMYRVARGVQKAVGGTTPTEPAAPPPPPPATASKPAPIPDAPAPSSKPRKPPQVEAVEARGRAKKADAAKSAPAAKGETPSLDELQLTPAEISQGVKWHEQGIPPEVIMHRILSSRQLTLKTRTTTPDQAREAVRQRNLTGKWQD